MTKQSDCPEISTSSNQQSPHQQTDNHLLHLRGSNLMLPSSYFAPEDSINDGLSVSDCDDEAIYAITSLDQNCASSCPERQKPEQNSHYSFPQAEGSVLESQELGHGHHSSSLPTSPNRPVVNRVGSMEFGIAQPVEYKRPEFLYCQVMKPADIKRVGLTVKNTQEQNEGHVSIAHIEPKGLFGKSTLRVGDRIVSVNNISCCNKSSKFVARLIVSSSGTLAIVVQNEGGNPNLVSCSVQKTTDAEKVGISIKSRASGTVLVTRINSRGLFANSLLTQGSRVVSVNGKPVNTGLKTPDVGSLIRNCKEVVTLVVQPKMGFGMVFASEANPVVCQALWRYRIAPGTFAL